MQHFMLDTYHGPLVITARRHDWIVSAPSRPSEVFAGPVPTSCLQQARRISTDEAVAILRDCSLPVWADPPFSSDSHDPVLAIGA